MSDFENMACKAMAVILIILLCFIGVQLIGCTSASNGAINVNKPLIHNIDPTDYPLLGHDGELHKFGENLHKMIFPKHNQRLTQYCAIHFQWENVNVVYSRMEDNQWGYKYIITKNKKQ